MHVRAFASIIKVGLKYPHDDCAWINGTRECSTHAAPQLFLPARGTTAALVHVSMSLHHMSVTHVGMVRILFNGGYYFT